MPLEIANAVQTPIPRPDMSSPSSNLENLAFIISTSTETPTTTTTKYSDILHIYISAPHNKEKKKRYVTWNFWTVFLKFHLMQMGFLCTMNIIRTDKMWFLNFLKRPVQRKRGRRMPRATVTLFLIRRPLPGWRTRPRTTLLSSIFMITKLKFPLLDHVTFLYRTVHFIPTFFNKPRRFTNSRICKYHTRRTKPPHRKNIWKPRSVMQSSKNFRHPETTQ